MQLSSSQPRSPTHPTPIALTMPEEDDMFQELYGAPSKPETASRTAAGVATFVDIDLAPEPEKRPKAAASSSASELTGSEEDSEDSEDSSSEVGHHLPSSRVPMDWISGFPPVCLRFTGPGHRP